MASIHLASKVEKQPCKIRDLIKVFHYFKQIREHETIIPLSDASEKFIYARDEVVKADRSILKAFGFWFHIEHPHKLIKVYNTVATISEASSTHTFGMELHYE